MIDTGLHDKVVVVTGANNPHGIGAAAAKAFARQRAKVFLHYFRDGSPTQECVENAASPGKAFYHAQQAKDAHEVLKNIRDRGGEAHAWEADLSDVSAIRTVFDEAERTLGPVSVLVNNAAYWEGDTFLPTGAELSNKLHELWMERPDQISAQSFERIFNINTRAPVLLMAEFARRHRERRAAWGRIVNVSTDGAHCFPSEISYGASKFALESYTRSAAIELGPSGIAVNAVSLGPVQTGWITPELEREVLPTIPLGKIGNPEDVADVIVFLASDQARWVTGQILYVGGGHRM
jgi:3-oxoacyl-[acyl-carrier protein] reductase